MRDAVGGHGVRRLHRKGREGWGGRRGANTSARLPKGGAGQESRSIAGVAAKGVDTATYALREALMHRGKDGHAGIEIQGRPQALETGESRLFFLVHRLRRGAMWTKLGTRKTAGERIPLDRRAPDQRDQRGQGRMWVVARGNGCARRGPERAQRFGTPRAKRGRDERGEGPAGRVVL